jgi:hypothetical protein
MSVEQTKAAGALSATAQTGSDPLHGSEAFDGVFDDVHAEG